LRYFFNSILRLYRQRNRPAVSPRSAWAGARHQQARRSCCPPCPLDPG